MTLADTEKLVSAYEKLVLDVQAQITARAATKVVLPADKIDKLDKALGSPEAVTAFLASMPATPGAEAILDAFGGNPEKLGVLVNTVLGGNMKVLAVLAAKGCKGDPARLLALTDQFSGNPKPLQDLLSEGGLAANPDVLAAILQEGCGSDPAKLADVCTTFTDKADRDKLSATLSAGGLGLAPGAAGALAGADGGGLRKLSRELSTPDELSKLNGLLAKGGLDGSASGRPGLLADVVNKGLGGNPKRLLELHGAFATPGADAGLGTLSQMLDGMDGTDGLAGERMARTMTNFKTKLGITDAEAAQKLRDPFMKSVTTMGRAAAAPDLMRGTTDKMANAAGERPAPDPARQAGLLEAGLKPGAAAGLLGMALADPAERALATGLSDAPALTLARAGSLEMALVPPGPDAEQSDKTKAATKAVTDATAALQKQARGGKLTDVKSLDGLCDGLLGEAALECDSALKTLAVAAAKAGAAAIATALARLAAAVATGPAGEALARLGEIETLRAGAGEAEKAALKAMSGAALTAVGAAAAASEDPALAAAKAGDAVTAGFPLNERPGETTKRDDAATAAATAAVAATAQVIAAPAPADPALLTRAAALAGAAATAGRAAPGQAAAKAAFDAAKALSDAVAQACKVAAGFSETAAALASPGGAKSLNMASSCETTREILGKSPGGAAGAKALGTAAAATRSGALSIAEVERLQADGGLKDAALQAATRAASAGKDIPPDPLAIDTAGKQADKLATDAKAKADTKCNALKLADPAVAAGFEVLLEETRSAAMAALRYGPLAVDDTARTGALKAAGDALAEITLSAGRLAKKQRELVEALLVTARNTAFTTVAAARDNATVNKPAAGRAFDAGKAAIGAVASSVLADILLTDATVQTARDAATAAAVEAAVPGADPMLAITALKAARDADEKVATAAGVKFGVMVAAIPAFTENPDTFPANPGKLATAPNAATTIRSALGGADAFCGSLAKWRETADALHKALMRGIKELEAIKVPTPKQAADLLTLQADLGLSTAKLAAIRTAQGGHSADAAPLETVIEQSRKWTIWTNKRHSGHANNQALQNTNGFAVAAGTEAARGTAGGAANSFSGASRDTLVRAASGFQSDPYVGAAVVGQPLVDGSPAAVDMKHVCGRHVTESYDYGELNDSGPTPDDHKAGQLLLGKFAGAPATASLAEQALIKIAKENNKVNSVLPDVVTKANLALFAGQAMEAVQVNYPGVSLAATVWASRTSQNPSGWKEESVGVLGPPPIRVTVGLDMQMPPPVIPPTVPTVVKVRMMYASNGDTLTMADMLTIGRAIGL